MITTTPYLSAIPRFLHRSKRDQRPSSAWSGINQPLPRSSAPYSAKPATVSYRCAPAFDNRHRLKPHPRATGR